jgi:hypothetical protein
VKDGSGSAAATKQVLTNKLKPTAHIDNEWLFFMR